jgi:hypothetical protein
MIRRALLLLSFLFGALGCSVPTAVERIPVRGLLSWTKATADVQLVGAGDIANCGSYKDAETAALIQQLPAAQVFTAGDNAYPDGTAADWQCFHQTWGQFKSRIKFPAMGNHDYDSGTAAAAFDYFNGPGVDSGVAGHRARGYYARDFGAWRITVLNKAIGLPNGSPQLNWYKAELAAHPDRCQLTIVHAPLFATQANGATLSPSLVHAWNAAVGAKVEAWVSGSFHVYEVFERQLSDRSPSPSGVRQFVAGTGGAGLGSLPLLRAPNSRKMVNSHGVILLTLGPSSYRWEFRKIDGTVADSGSDTCDVATAPDPEPDPDPIELVVTGRMDSLKTYSSLDWTGANGDSVKVFRDALFLSNQLNDGHYVNSRTKPTTTITTSYQVCEFAGRCSNVDSVTYSP